jgi:hypothetical protein
MQLTTKYEIGDTAWIIDNNKPTAAKISGLQAQAGRITYTSGAYLESGVVNYFLYGFGDKTFPESEIFPTKEELLADFAK